MTQPALVDLETLAKELRAVYMAGGKCTPWGSLTNNVRDHWLAVARRAQQWHAERDKRIAEQCKSYQEHVNSPAWWLSKKILHLLGESTDAG